MSASSRSRGATVQRMAFGGLGEADWWWEHALDGLMGGVLTGVIAGVAVWLTLRHERRLAHELAGQEAAARVNAAAMILTPAVDGTDPGEDEKLTALQVATIEFCARVQQRWPATATGFQDLSRALHPSASPRGTRADARSRSGVEAPTSGSRWGSAHLDRGP